MPAYAEFGSPVDDGWDILSYSFAMHAGAVAGGADRNAQIHDCQMQIGVEEHTEDLFQACVSGKRIDKVEIYLYQSESSLEPYLTYVMKDVYVTNCHTSSHGTGIGLNYGSLKYHYANKK